MKNVSYVSNALWMLFSITLLWQNTSAFVFDDSKTFNGESQDVARETITLPFGNNGKVIGVRANYTDSFLGMRFATAERFVPPVGIEYDDEVVIEATKLGPECLQPTYGKSGKAKAMGSEDCLFLNVYSPSADEDLLRPVFVWIHGGGFMVGSGMSYDGSNLAKERDAVVVTLNYRLGAFGFFYIEDFNGGTTGGNLGLLDQQEALKWVQKHIKSFGGDPDDVTIFGQSAGGSSVALQVVARSMQEPEPEPLFHGVVAMSMFYAVSPIEAAVKSSRTLLSNLNCSDLACTQAKQAEEVLVAAGDKAPVLDYMATHQFCMEHPEHEECFKMCSHVNQDCSATGLPFGPIADGKFLPLDPLAAFKRGDGVKGLRRVVAGNVRDEGPDVMLFPPFKINEWQDGFSFARFMHEFLPVFHNMLGDFGLNPRRGFEEEMLMEFAYLYYLKHGPETYDNKEIWREVAFNAYQDAVYICPSFIWLDGASSQAPEVTSGYRFDHLRKCRKEDDLKEVAKVHVSHGSELPLLFDDPDQDRLACPASGVMSVHGKPFDASDAKVGAILRRGLVFSSKNKEFEWPQWLKNGKTRYLQFSDNGGLKKIAEADEQKRCNFWARVSEAKFDPEVKTEKEVATE